jgi:addiction module HigA family antidote
MTIRIDELADMDFSDVADTTQARMPPIHPGEILMEDWMKPLGISQYALSKGINVSPRRINEIVHGLRGISIDTALRLARFFGTDAQSWINLQTRYEAAKTVETLRPVLEKIHRFVPGRAIA